MAKIYADKDQVTQLFTEFWGIIFETTPILTQFKEKGLSLMFVLSDYDTNFSITPDGIKFGQEAASDPLVTMTMKGETVHKFWLEKLNMPLALATGGIKTKGPFPKVLELTPLLKPGHAIYPKICAKYKLPLK